MISKFLKILNLQPRFFKGIFFSHIRSEQFSEQKTINDNLFVFSDPAGDTRNRIKTSSLEIGFLGIKILLVCYESQLNKEWFRIARTIKDMGNRSGPQVFSKIVPYFYSRSPTGCPGGKHLCFNLLRQIEIFKLKPLQNKMGQKNLGYPRKKQSFSL